MATGSLARRGGFWLRLALLLLAGCCLAVLTARYGVVNDWTAGARVSLPNELQMLLKRLPGELSVTSYASPASGLRPTVSAFFARYQRFKPDLDLRFVDPEQDPAAMRAAGITVDGELVLVYDGREQRLTELSDLALGNTLLRFTRDAERLVAFVTGHGERKPAGVANADMGSFMRQAEQRGMRAVPLDFAAAAMVPEGTDLVVLASPLVALQPAAVGALQVWLDSGGNLLWLSEPDTRDLGLGPLADALGISVLPGTLVDGQGAALGLADPRVVATTSYPEHPITRDFALTTVYPQVAPLSVTATPAWQVTPFLQSGPQSWNERQTINNAASSAIQLDGNEQRGPLAFGLAFTRARDGGGQQRVVVLGDGDFLSNSFLGNGGNRAFGMRIFDWLLGDEELLELPPRLAPDRQLQLGQSGLNAIALGFLLLLPALLLAIAGWVGWRRWRR